MNAKVETKPTKIVGNVRGFKNQKTVERATNIAVYIILAVLSIIWLAPIVWLILDSLRIESTGRVSYFIPQQFGFDNYIQLFTDPRIPYLQWFLNTFIVAIFTSLISTIIVLLTSYTFSRLRFKGRQGMMKLLMILGMFPGFMAMIAIYFILKGIGLLPSGSEQVPISNYLI